MGTEHGYKHLIFLYTGKVKRLQEELRKTMEKKREAERDLRDLKKSKTT